MRRRVIASSTVAMSVPATLEIASRSRTSGSRSRSRAARRSRSRAAVIASASWQWWTFLLMPSVFLAGAAVRERLVLGAVFSVRRLAYCHRSTGLGDVHFRDLPAHEFSASGRDWSLPSRAFRRPPPAIVISRAAPAYVRVSSVGRLHYPCARDARPSRCLPTRRAVEHVERRPPRSPAASSRRSCTAWSPSRSIS